MAEVTLEFLGLQVSRLLERQERLQDDMPAHIECELGIESGVLKLTHKSPFSVS